MVPYFNLKINITNFMYIMYGMDSIYNKYGKLIKNYWIQLKYIDGVKQIDFKTFNERETALNSIISAFSSEEEPIENVHIERLNIYANPYNMAFIKFRKEFNKGSYLYYTDLAFTDPDLEILSAKFINYSEAKLYEEYLNSLIKYFPVSPPEPIIDKLEKVILFSDDLEIPLGIIKETSSNLTISIKVMEAFDGGSQLSVGTLDEHEKIFSENLVDLDYPEFYSHLYMDNFLEDTLLYIFRRQDSQPTKGKLLLTILLG